MIKLVYKHYCDYKNATETVFATFKDKDEMDKAIQVNELVLDKFEVVRIEVSDDK